MKITKEEKNLLLKLASGILDATQALPARAVDVVLYEGGVSAEDIHRKAPYRVNSAKAPSASSETASEVE